VQSGDIVNWSSSFTWVAQMLMSSSPGSGPLLLRLVDLAQPELVLIQKLW
jgi:hypothetical protein